MITIQRFRIWDHLRSLGGKSILGADNKVELEAVRARERRDSAKVDEWVVTRSSHPQAQQNSTEPLGQKQRQDDDRCFAATSPTTNSLTTRGSPPLPLRVGPPL
jgi:hypothetical protein